ncbi:MAG: hypothetical protein HC880_01560 [Bacteroidia bacterium]|nr:hypothetical protein [Bacteroidia bacterium]
MVFISDYFIIKNYLDLTLYVVRYNYTRTRQFEQMNTLHETEKVHNLYLIFNDVKYSLMYDAKVKGNYYFQHDDKDELTGLKQS